MALLQLLESSPYKGRRRGTHETANEWVSIRVDGRSVNRVMKFEVPSYGMEINGERLAPGSQTRRHGPHRVEIGVGNLENHGSIEQRLDHFFASRGVLTPQLQLAAEVRPPILVQIDHHRQATMQTTITVGVGVCMDLEFSSLLHDVKPSSTKIRIGKQRFDSGEFSQEVEKGCGVQHGGKGVGVLLEIDSRAQIGLDVPFVSLVNPVLAGSWRQLLEKGLQVV